MRSEREELGGGRFRRGDEGRGAPYDTTRLQDVEGRADRLSGRDPGGEGSTQGQSGREPEDGANHASIIAPSR